MPVDLALTAPPAQREPPAPSDTNPPADSMAAILALLQEQKVAMSKQKVAMSEQTAASQRLEVSQGAALGRLEGELKAS